MIRDEINTINEECDCVGGRIYFRIPLSQVKWDSVMLTAMVVVGCLVDGGLGTSASKSSIRRFVITGLLLVESGYYRFHI